LKISLPTASSQGRRQRGGFISLRKFCAESPWLRPSAKMVFLFFEKNHVPSARGKGRRQRRFLIFFKKNLCRAPRAITLGKAGNTRAGKIFPRVAERNCHKHSTKAPLLTAPLRKEATFCFIFLLFTLTNIYIYIHIYIYIYIYHMQQWITHIYHIHMFIHTTCVHEFIHTTSPSKQVHKSTKYLKSNETSSEHDQLSPRAYGECSCGGKGGTGDWRTCSPLGAC
jgi:hypothetical protein